ncbi:hypothetical protein [Flexithrix dorotheae]|uniref:hypothetical protein n=1 Tax=Flexithrix dorotheae TaxID=70993 RepID=UPI00037F80BD|nr:hypothetical protein [Flexithrix dorotheae]
MAVKVPSTEKQRKFDINEQKIPADNSYPKEYEPIITLGVMMLAVFIISFFLIQTGFFG